MKLYGGISVFKKTLKLLIRYVNCQDLFGITGSGAGGDGSFRG